MIRLASYAPEKYYLMKCRFSTNRCSAYAPIILSSNRENLFWLLYNLLANSLSQENGNKSGNTLEKITSRLGTYVAFLGSTQSTPSGTQYKYMS